MTTTNKQQGGKYGVFSLMALIVGIVIGSGIFAKNAGLVAGNGSILNTMIAWAIGAVLVIAILIAFLEIISITEISNEQATMANWAGKLTSRKFGNYIGYFMVFIYFPMVIAGLIAFAGSQFSETLSVAGIDILGNSAPDEVSTFASQITIEAIAVVIIVLLVFMNSFTSKPGKLLQNVGTCIKTIPLFFLIILIPIMFGKGDANIWSPEAIQQGVFFNNGDNQTAINKILGESNAIDWSAVTSEQIANFDASTFDFDTIGATSKQAEDITAIYTNYYDKLGRSTITLIFITLPGILFAIDGFLLAGSLSKEAKKPTHFKSAFLFSIIIIITIYVLYSFATLTLGDPNEAGYGSIANAISHCFENKTAADILAVTADAIITLSMVVGISGCVITSMRMYSDLSVHNSVVDPNFNSIDRNKHGVAPISGFWIGANTAVWILVAVIFDSINVFLGPDGTGSLSISDFMTNIIVVEMFIFYAILISAAVVNRFTKKAEVKKNIAFFPAAIISVLLMTVITLYFAYLLVWPASGDTSNVVWITTITFTGIFLVYQVGLYAWLTYRTSSLSNEFKDRKAAKAKEFYGETELKSSEQLLDEAINSILVGRQARK